MDGTLQRLQFDKKGEVSQFDPSALPEILVYASVKRMRYTQVAIVLSLILFCIT
jgi:hypothetical protein